MASPQGTKPHIGIFGKRNAGKSSFINAITKQSLSIVSDIAGTTTDAVLKAVELADLGPVVLIDTAGIDDEGELGEKRIEATRKVFEKVDVGIILLSSNQLDSVEREIASMLYERNTPFVFIKNKEDLLPVDQKFKEDMEREFASDLLSFNSLETSDEQIRSVIELLKKTLPNSLFNNPTIIGDLVSEGDLVLLVTPIDIEAPKGRLIMPQVQTIRDALDNDCMTLVLKERELDSFFKRSNITPRLVITDSQAFLKVSASVPSHIPLTSFSILFARLKGDLDIFIKGSYAIKELEDNSRVLILESCSHHVHGDDIGRVKIPRWITQFTGKKIEFDVVSGMNDLPRPITEYKLVVQCGGCMLTRKQVMNRIRPAVKAGIPVTNYGMCIAYTLGIFERAIAPFRKVKEDYL